MFVRHDWTLFRTIGTLCQRAGVSPERLQRLVAKELCDNALDAAGDCRVGLIDGGFLIEDDGPGLAGTDEEIANLFSIARPLTSSKLLRLPTRGALGNGLRVVAGAVMATGGTLQVRTNGRAINIAPVDDGSSKVVSAKRAKDKGTRIEIRFGAGVPGDDDPLEWATAAIRMASGGVFYGGKSSPWWYDDESFFELCQAAVGQTARDLISKLEGCTGAKAGKIAAKLKGKLASDLSRKEAAKLLAAARATARKVKPARLGFIGSGNGELPTAYAKEKSSITIAPGRGGASAHIPNVIEVWAERADSDRLEFFVNRTPITGTIDIQRQPQRAKIGMFGCGLSNAFQVGIAPVRIVCNVTTPYMPLSSDGKEPDLQQFIDTIALATERACRKANRSSGGNRKQDVKRVIIDCLDAAIATASGNGTLRYSQRQLYYVVRTIVLEEIGIEPKWGWFCRVLTEIEFAGRTIEGMYRDTRGTLYHPHEGTDIPLGTLAVEQYTRPKWTFSKVVYIEKEGLFEILKAEKWPERNDCALMSAKGFASRAVRDVIDLMAETDEAVTFFAVHDADASGTLIFQSLTEGTMARAARKAKVFNLGLEPAEAIEMGLAVEKIPKGKRKRPVAKYVDEEYCEWLQENRVELNAMTSPQFIGWLDRKIREAAPDCGKVIPPVGVLGERLTSDVEAGIRQNLTAEAIASFGVDAKAAAELLRLQPAIRAATESLPETVRDALESEPELHWVDPVQEASQEIVRDGSPPNKSNT